MPRKPRRTHGRLRRLTVADRARKLARNARRGRPVYRGVLIPVGVRSMQRPPIRGRNTTADAHRHAAAATDSALPIRSALAFIGRKRKRPVRDERLPGRAA